MRLHIESFKQSLSLSDLIANPNNRLSQMIIGDFSSSYPGRFSYFCPQPSKQFVFYTHSKGHPFLEFQKQLDTYCMKTPEDCPVDFICGWVGFLSYDLCRYVERLPDNVSHDFDVPLMQFGFYDHLIAWDHQTQCGYCLVLEYDDQVESVDERFQRLHKCVSAVGEKTDRMLDLPASFDRWDYREDCELSRQDYIDKILKAKEYIKAGDIYEINLSHRFQRSFEGSVGQLYHRLTQQNPSSYCALLCGQAFDIVCSSPELFLRKRGRSIQTRPIKGTIARGKTVDQDQEHAQRLFNSEKERAELNMIIDLERNDLSRVCQPGSVEVLQERDIEQHPTLFHAVATISGILKDNITQSDILRATFPGGSISGAPKIRAMEIIDELEPTARSIYTGSIGWFGVDGQFDLNIAIRTIILQQGLAYFQAGGAIVDDSIAEDEYEETLTKARALATALITTQQLETTKQTV